MCLSPIKSSSNKKYFLPGRYESYYNEYPCGECAECRQDRQLTEYVRAQWMAKETLEINHGFIVFDTLTYNDINLPHLSDVLFDMGLASQGQAHVFDNFYNMSCFRPRDWRLFLARLRTMLKYEYGLNEDALDYLMASEYGSDEFTSRPHYHVVFYVNSPLVDPVRFSELVHDCWGKGITDGVVDKGVSYFKQKRLFTMKDKDSLSISVLNVISYVSKYIGKQEDFESKFDSCIDDLMHCVWPDTKWLSFNELWKLKTVDIDKYRLIKKFVKSVRPFSKKSHGYGERFVDWLKSDDPEAIEVMKHVCMTGSLVLPMNKSQNKYECKLPQYYYRKLFCEQYIDFNGHLNWRLNSLGLAYKKSQIKSSIDHAVDKMEDFWQNRSFFRSLSDDVVSKERFERDMKFLERVFAQRHRKKFFQFVCSWYRLYEGRLFDDRYVSHSHYSWYGKVSLPSPDEMMDIIVYNDRLNGDVDFKSQILDGHQIGSQILFEGRPVIFNYISPSQQSEFGSRYLSDCYMGDDRQGYLRVKDEYGKVIDRAMMGLSSSINIDDSSMFGSKHCLKLQDLFNSPCIDYDTQRYFEDAYTFKKIYDRYRGQLRDNKQKQYDFLHDVEDRLAKVYGVSKKHRK